MRYRYHPARRRAVEDQTQRNVAAGVPAAGRFVLAEPSYDRQTNPLPRGLGPRDVERILVAANYGDTGDLCKLAAELEDRNWDIQHNMGTRRNALAGCEWTVDPGEDTPLGREVAEAFDDTLRNCGEADDLDTFEDLLRGLMGAVIAPFAASEIVWLPGGDIEGFKAIESRHFTLRDSEWPRLITVEQAAGMELPPYKFIIQRFRRGTADICKGGLIRTLAWLHVLQNYPIKDWSAYTERFGMPFIVARLDQNAWEQERDVHKAMIRNFGPSGGGVFTKATEIQLLQAAAGGENTYKLLVDYCGDAITKVLLGQLASSAEATGLSGGDAQSEVRQDILFADARAIEAAIRAQLAAPWTRFRYGEAAPVPRLKINAEPPEDVKADAEVKQMRANTISLMASAGWEPKDPEELKEMLGITWQPKPQPQQSSAPAANAMAFAGEGHSAPKSRPLESWMGPLANAVEKAADPEETPGKTDFIRRIERICADPPGDDSAVAAEIERELTRGLEKGRGEAKNGG